MKIKRGIFLLVTLLFCVQAVPIHAQEERTLTVFAAASLTDAFEEIADNFEEANPGVEVVFSFGSSSDLAAQLAEGAPADVFASANPRQMQLAVEAERIADNPVMFAYNWLVLVVPADNPAEIESLHDLANSGVLIVMAAEGVPIRDYTETMLDKLADDPDYGEEFRDEVRDNVISEEENVRQLIAKIVLGEADAGIVYFSDVTPEIEEDVLMFDIPAEYNLLAAYPITVTDDSENPELAQAFVDYVLSDEGQAILEDWNFVPLETETPEPMLEPTPESSDD